MDIDVRCHGGGCQIYQNRYESMRNRSDLTRLRFHESLGISEIVTAEISEVPNLIFMYAYKGSSRPDPTDKIRQIGSFWMIPRE